MRQLIFILSVLILPACAILNNERPYIPNSPEEYYFPSVSAEFAKAMKDCFEKEEFPCDFAVPNDSLEDFSNRWYSKHLKSMKEPIIYSIQDSERDIIRFTHLGTWEKPFSYRIENIRGIVTLTYNKTKGLGGYKAGRRIKHKQKEISPERWKEILNKLEAINFWEIDTHDPNVVLDGTEWILEVLINGKFHFVRRTSPAQINEPEFAELCMLIANAGIK